MRVLTVYSNVGTTLEYTVKTLVVRVVLLFFIEKKIPVFLLLVLLATV